MNERDEHVREMISEVASALQAAAPLADRLRVVTAKQSEDAVALDGAIERAVRALKTLQPGDGRENGRA